jgi:D-aminoacyl-tRNA deacylase
MRVLIQRVLESSVEVDGQICGHINKGLLLLVGFCSEDDSAVMDKMIRKILQLRIFSDEAGKMNLSVTDVSGSLLLVSQFTLYADCKKGNRPSYIRASPPVQALEQYQNFVQKFRNSCTLQIETGIFAAEMKVQILNDGPVSIWLDSEDL